MHNRKSPSVSCPELLAGLWHTPVLAGMSTVQATAVAMLRHLVKKIQQTNFNRYWEGKLEEDLSFAGKTARVHSFHYRKYV
jgi:hypothetical protein